MKKILCILGKSAAGKDFVTNLLIKKFNFVKTVSYTTRPKRKGEKEGKDYYFINDDNFSKLEKENAFLESTFYIVDEKKWSYGYTKDCFVENKINIVICNPRGFECFQNSELKNNLYALYLECSDEIREKRYYARDEKATQSQWAARQIQDKLDFAGIKELLEKTKNITVINEANNIYEFIDEKLINFLNK